LQALVQLSVVKANTIKDLDLRFGYNYFNIIADEQMVEFHIDYYWSRVSTNSTTSSVNSEGPQTDSQPQQQSVVVIPKKQKQI
jgi:hypothetical protein